MTVRAILTVSVALTALIALGLPGFAAAQSGYVTEIAVPGSPFKGLHGLAFDSEDVLHGAGITGMSLYRIDTETGAVVTIVGPPLGVADDLAFGPDGTIAWTARDAIHVQDPDGSIRAVAEDVDGVNSINFGPEGRLYFTRIFRADELYEGFLDGRKPRLITDGLKGLNGFEVTGDGKIIGPQFFGNAIVSVDVETGVIETLADGIQTPAAVNLTSNGDVIALGYRSGKVFRIDAKTRAVEEIAQLEDPPIDNLAIDSTDRVFISHSSHNGITELNPDTGETSRVIWGDLSAPAGLTIIEQDGHELVLSADAWGHRTIDPSTGDVTVLPVGPGVFGSAAVAADTDRIVITNTTPAGMVQIVDRATGANIDSLFGFGAPYGVLVEKSGNILVTDYATDSLIRIENSEGRPRTIIANDLGGPVGLVSDGADGVYITGHTDGTVSWVDLTSGKKTTITSGLAHPEGIGRLPDGTLAVAEVGTRRLVLVDPGNGTVTGIASDLPIGFDLGGAGRPPAIVTGVTVTRDGSIYVTGDANNSLIRVRSN
jgi:sugar lactone lactonase YvrE